MDPLLCRRFPVRHYSISSIWYESLVAEPVTTSRFFLRATDKVCFLCMWNEMIPRVKLRMDIVIDLSKKMSTEMWKSALLLASWKRSRLRKQNISAERVYAVQIIQYTIEKSSVWWLHLSIRFWRDVRWTSHALFFYVSHHVIFSRIPWSQITVTTCHKKCFLILIISPFC